MHGHVQCLPSTRDGLAVWEVDMLTRHYLAIRLHHLFRSLGVFLDFVESAPHMPVGPQIKDALTTALSHVVQVRVVMCFACTR